jgi:hypothetical protein
MACEYICDGCGEVTKGIFYSTNPTRWFKPDHWFQRSNDKGIQDACSRECAEKINTKTGERTPIAPRGI